MKNFKKVLSITTVLILVLTLAGCAKCINTEYQDIEVRIVDAEYRPVLSTGTYQSKKRRTRRTLPKYEVVVEYEGAEYKFIDFKTYRAYKDLVGETVPATLRVRTYDDGTVKYNIESLGSR